MLLEVLYTSMVDETLAFPTYHFSLFLGQLCIDTETNMNTKITLLTFKVIVLKNTAGMHTFVTII